MVSVDSSLIIQIINFILLIWIMNIVLYRPVREMLRKRGKRVAGLEENIEKFHATAREKEAEFAEGIKSARTRGLKEKEALLQEAEAEEKEIIGKINAKAQEELAKVRENVAREAESVRSTLMREVDAFARDIGHKILGRTV